MGRQHATTQTAVPGNAAWPALRVADWVDTRDTLHMWTQIVGKIRLAHAPLLVDHQLRIRASDGGSGAFALRAMPVAEFYTRTFQALGELGIESAIRARPNEVEPAIPFAEDYQHASYDPGAAHRFWRQLLAAHRVIGEFRAHFVGKVSPVHFFWGAMDLACTRFSGRAAPRHPGGAPNCGDWVADLGQFLLPYEAVRRAADPDRTLTEFLHTTYEAAAEHGHWDRTTLEDDPTRWHER